MHTQPEYTHTHYRTGKHISRNVANHTLRKTKLVTAYRGGEHLILLVSSKRTQQIWVQEFFSYVFRSLHLGGSLWCLYHSRTNRVPKAAPT